jgi:hypothetical protein
MSEAKFTPGPWVVTKYGDLIGSNGEKVVFSIGQRSNPVWKANAILAQTSPELLDALSRMVDMWNSICDVNGWDPEHNVQYGEALAAIAKATGA